jgi:hypothetical protein
MISRHTVCLDSFKQVFSCIVLEVLETRCDKSKQVLGEAEIWYWNDFFCHDCQDEGLRDSTRQYCNKVWIPTPEDASDL